MEWFALCLLEHDAWLLFGTTTVNLNDFQKKSFLKFFCGINSLPISAVLILFLLETITNFC